MAVSAIDCQRHAQSQGGYSFGTAGKVKNVMSVGRQREKLKKDV